MKELIYYPGFEVQSSEWLKFALLYIERLNPIIPSSGQPFLSEFHKFITNETDLLHVHRPSDIEGSAATLDALDCVDGILRSPDLYNPFLGNNIVARWTNRNRHDFIIYQEKYTHEWEQFCLDNQLGTKTNQGIGVNRQLGYVYMTLLAQVIADSRGISPITDYPRLNNLHLALRKTMDDTQQQVELAQATLNLTLPANLSEIGIKDIITLRNSPQFKSDLRAFHQELDSFLNAMGEKQNPALFVNSLGSAWDDLSEQITMVSADTVPLAIGLWFVIQSPVSGVEPILINSAAGLSLLLKSSMSIRKTWKHTASRRQARKYLANISHLKRVPLFR